MLCKSHSHRGSSDLAFWGGVPTAVGLKRKRNKIMDGKEGNTVKPAYLCPRSGDMYLEQLDPGITVTPHCASNNPPLSNKWKTSQVTRMEYADAGIYMPYSLHNTPHWTQPVERRKLLEKQIGEKTGLPPCVLGVKSGPHCHPGQVLAINCNDGEAWRTLEAMHAAYPWIEVARECLRRNPTCARGNIPRNQGFTEQNSDTVSSKVTTMPAVIKATGKDTAERMVQATAMLHATCKLFAIGLEQLLCLLK